MEFPRERYLRQLTDGMWNGKVKVVTGIRRCGKSYLLFNLFKKHLLSSGVKEENIIAVDLEDYGNKKLRDADALYDYVASRTNGEKCYLLIDEIQFIENFSDVLNGFRHVENLDTYVTGSNSKMLSSDVVTEFRGREYEVRMHPLSFSEFLESRGNEDANMLLDEYMVYGGMPEVVAERDMRKKSEILKDMVKRIYLKDISERNRLKSDAVLSDVFDVVSSAIGSPVNPKKISDTLKTKGNPATVSTVSKYLSTFEDAFVFEKAVRYDIKGRKYIGSLCKYYCEDLGLRNAKSNFRQVEYTHLMENLIYNELRIRRYDVDIGLVDERKMVGGIRRSKQFEVDFVVNGWNKKYYIQSVYSIRDETKKNKEIKPLECITDAFGRIVVVHDDIVPRSDENGITYIGIIDFLTKNESLGP